MFHVLIIEDQPLLALSLEHLLMDLGVSSFDLAETEAEAIDIARRRRPDLITADRRLPQGDGVSAVEQILREHGDIPVIYLTGTPEDLAVDSRQTSRVLSKPYSERAMVQAFRDIAPLAA